MMSGGIAAPPGCSAPWTARAGSVPRIAGSRAPFRNLRRFNFLMIGIHRARSGPDSAWAIVTRTCVTATAKVDLAPGQVRKSREVRPEGIRLQASDPFPLGEVHLDVERSPHVLL